jgi:hypothetical protein
MLDFLLPETHAISILKKDHDTVKELFDKFEKAESASEKERIIARALAELKMHAVVEEEIFYPAVRKHVGPDIMKEADEEHHVARVLIAELDHYRGGGDHRNAKFNVLAENVRHHIKEEENEMLPKARELDIDFEALGRRILDRKKELRREGIPRDAEHTMVGHAKGRGDSPAVASRKRAPSTKVARKDGATHATNPKGESPHAGH